MLDTRKLSELAEILNIKGVCDASGLNYYTIIRKIYRFRANPSNGRLRETEAEALAIGLSKYNIQVSSPLGK
jgi:hypothetical protein